MGETSRRSKRNSVRGGATDDARTSSLFSWLLPHLAHRPSSTCQKTSLTFLIQVCLSSSILQGRWMDPFGFLAFPNPIKFSCPICIPNSRLSSINIFIFPLTVSTPFFAVHYPHPRIQYRFPDDASFSHQTQQKYSFYPHPL